MLLSCGSVTGTTAVEEVELVEIHFECKWFLICCWHQRKKSTTRASHAPTQAGRNPTNILYIMYSMIQYARASRQRAYHKFNPECHQMEYQVENQFNQLMM